MADQEQAQPERKPRVRIVRVIALFVSVIWLLSWLASMNEAAPK